MTARAYPAPRKHLFDPPEMLRELRNTPLSRVTIWNGREVWLATRYKDARFILQDPRFSADITNPGIPTLGPLPADPQPQMSRMDEPRHGQIRRMLADDFLSTRIDGLRSNIERVTMARIDKMIETGPPLDLFTALALPMPEEVMNDLLDIPPADRQMIHDHGDILNGNDSTEDECSAAFDTLYSLCERLLTERRANPTGDLLSRLARNEVRAGRISHKEACMETLTLLVTGHSTTAGLICFGSLMMLLDPELLKVIGEEPETVQNVVEELLRYYTPQNFGIPRVATEDVRVGETLISAGEGVMVSTQSANRDDSVFNDADTFDITRRGARHHLAFGHGVHKCLGQWLARAELQIALPALATRMPTLRLAAPLEEMSVIDDSQVLRLRELPVTW